MSTKPVKANTKYEPISLRTASEAEVTATMENINMCLSINAF